MCLEPGSVSSLCPARSPVLGSFLPKKLSASLYLIEVIAEMMRFEKRRVTSLNVGALRPLTWQY